MGFLFSGQSGQARVTTAKSSAVVYIFSSEMKVGRVDLSPGNLKPVMASVYFAPSVKVKVLAAVLLTRSTKEI
jgi:hypothetical protein